MWPAIIAVAVFAVLWVGFRLWLRSKRQQFLKFAVETRTRLIEEAGGEEAWARRMEEGMQRTLARYRADPVGVEDDALSAYAKLLLKFSFELQQESTLPLPKSQLKGALIAEAQEAARRGMDDYVQTLRHAYSHLSRFVDDERCIRNWGLHPWEMSEEDQQHVGDDMSNLAREFDRRMDETPRG